MYWDGEVWTLQKRKLFFFWEDVTRLVRSIDGMDLVEPFYADEDLNQSEALRYFKFMNFNPDAEEPSYVDIMDDEPPQFESITDDVEFEKGIDDDYWVDGVYHEEMPIDEETKEEYHEEMPIEETSIQKKIKAREEKCLNITRLFLD